MVSKISRDGTQNGVLHMHPIRQLNNDFTIIVLNLLGGIHSFVSHNSSLNPLHISSLQSIDRSIELISPCLPNLAPFDACPTPVILNFRLRTPTASISQRNRIRPPPLLFFQPLRKSKRNLAHQFSVNAHPDWRRACWF